MLRNSRIILFCDVCILICIGIVMIYSASSIFAWEKLKDSAYYLRRHTIYFLIGALSAFWAMSIDYRLLKKYSKPILISSVVLLVILLLVGREIAGAKRWFRFAGLSFQPSEFAQVAMIIYIADLVSRKKNLIRDFSLGFVPAMAVLGFVDLLILVQPDLGTAVAMFLVVFIMIFVAGARLWHLGLIIASAIPFLYILIFSVPYRRARIMAFLNPWQDAKGSGFQIIQSQIALGSGGLLGAGLGAGKQKLFYLPAAHTDFIFSIIGEELGLVGNLAVILLFAVLVWLGLRISSKTKDNFGKFLTLGLTCLLGLKAVINIGVSTGFFPTKGLPLPFISYGGTSLVFDMLSVGLILNVAKSS